MASNGSYSLYCLDGLYSVYSCYDIYAKRGPAHDT